MTCFPTDSRARFGALLLCCAVLPTLSGCSLWNRVVHHQQALGCTQKPFSLNTQNRTALKVPEGMSAPDTRNAIRIPDLSDHPEKARAKNAPCLADPPLYFSTPLKLDLPPKPPKKKHWWTPWRKNPPPPPPASSAPAAQPTPATTPAPAAPAPTPPPPPAAPAPAPTSSVPDVPSPGGADSTPK